MTNKSCSNCKFGNVTCPVSPCGECEMTGSKWEARSNWDVIRSKDFGELVSWEDGPNWYEIREMNIIDLLDFLAATVKE